MNSLNKHKQLTPILKKIGEGKFHLKSINIVLGV